MVSDANLRLAGLPLLNSSAERCSFPQLEFRSVGRILDNAIVFARPSKRPLFLLVRFSHRNGVP
jgi:hypothetical protein